MPTDSQDPAISDLAADPDSMLKKASTVKSPAQMKYSVLPESK